MGTNPRRPYDDDYKLFVNLLGRQLATSMASVVLFEEEIRRGQKAARLAALDRQELSYQLQQRTEEAVQSEYRFTRMAEFAPVGMFIADSNGHINYCNDMWWQISRHSRAEGTEDLWMNSVRAEDRERLESSWRKLIDQKTTISVEFRFKCSQQNGDNTIDTWVLMSAFPERHPDGTLKSIFGCITDISSQKWAEKVQSERREEAVEMKRQQENFIDITSHEMRNPLSAILQCVDQITNSITAFAQFAVKEEVEQLLEGCLDAANTINLCASHQKRIVDDILTLSKADSNLLTVTPVDDQPVRVVQRALKMFESELIARDIEFEFKVDNSFEKLGWKWARLDPSRLRQVLINLITNAIKFTQGREKRLILVHLGASTNLNDFKSQGTEYLERNDAQRNAAMDIDNEEEWGTGERFYLHCSVTDTGPGLSDEELKLLFQRFQQASPRTHVQYSGSGLGLFISRILTEMQGGQIGVSSRHGVGSKFNFYIQCRKCLNPPADYEHISPFRIARKNQSPDNLGGSQPPGVSLSPAHSTQEAETGPNYDVLIVEDNIVNQKVLQRQLRNCGNNTFVANHGKEALQTLEKSRFWTGQEAEGVDISVILMDLEMPVMDGMTCARRIRELEREGTINAHIPIIAVTAYARPEQIADAKAAGIVSPSSFDYFRRGLY
jgi:PAS domain S-box-containing protein